MPKKSASARGTAQRAKPKTPKNFELVRQLQDEPATSTEQESPVTAPEAVTVSAASSSKTNEHLAIAAAPMPTIGKTSEGSKTSENGKVSAAARLAARRQTQQRQQRSNAALITSEHYSYVRKDLLYTAILAVIMLAAIITLYFVLGINA
jgi:cobalamin biosynthesis Mg chelatase CobN